MDVIEDVNFLHFVLNEQICYAKMQNMKMSFFCTFGQQLFFSAVHVY